jgi:type III restriction enzyme
MELKLYQQTTLDTLRAFLEQARLTGPQAAYDAMVRDPERKARLGRYGDAYRPLDGLPGTPYVCLRLPTGGGKTLLAAHSVKIVGDAWADKDRPVVLWLVPSNAIRRQTAEALKNPRHPYRQALDRSYPTGVRVFDIADFEQILAHDVGGQTIIIVGTIQTLRVANTEGRRVYAHNENLESHFAKLPRGLPGLELRPDGGPKFSLANLLRVHRPIMIVDEAHNAVTGLTRDLQDRVNPCAVIEFTATPRLANNTLHSVTAQELKAEQMVKLPIRLKEERNWQQAVTLAIAKRGELAAIARHEREHVRPILLFQAQPKNQEVTVEVLRQHLIEVENIPEKRIAVATGEQRGLDGVDLFDPACPIDCVITVEALKEGWDCSFAYVFCSVANIRSAIDTEQLLGRVLRMPYARRRVAPELNRAYAYVTATAFQEAANALCDCLVKMGFEESEAQENLEAEPEFNGLTGGLFGGSFGLGEAPLPAFTHALPDDPALAEALAKAPVAGLRVETTDGGPATLRVVGPLSATVAAAVTAALPEAHRPAFLRAVAQHRLTLPADAPPVARGDRFIVPALVTEHQGAFDLADADLFMEWIDWSLEKLPPRLDSAAFDLRESGDQFEIDVFEGRVAMRIDGEQEQLALAIDVEGWTEEALVLWLDGQVRQLDLSQGELIRWLSALVHDLTQTRRYSIAALMQAKFILARSIRDLINRHRAVVRTEAHQIFLFNPGARVEVSFDEAFAFEFTDGMYADQRPYRGRHIFTKHFLGPRQVPAFDGVAGGEEETCAAMIDSLSEVAFWVRNVPKHLNAFRLPKASGFHYPDFVLKLTDGRLLAVEYKGAQGATNDDTRERRAIGALWERASAGRCLYLIVEKSVDGLDAREQIKRKIAG